MRRPTLVPTLVPALVLAALLAVAGCTSSTSGNGTTGGSHAASTPAGTATVPPTTSAPPPSAPSTSARPTSVSPVPRSGPLNGFLVADLTFVGKLGWALGTVGCSSGSGRCAALAHTTDNGRTWHSIRPPNVHVSVPGFGTDCASACMTSVRFATPAVGYLFGGGRHGATWFTTDGGNSWRPLDGDAVALETLDGNVIRVGDHGCDPPGCPYTVQVSRIGSMTWTTVPLPGHAQTSTGVALARTGSSAYLLVFGHPAGGAQDARSTLWTSTDDGHHWTRRGEPCPQSSSEVDSSALTSAPDGSVTVLCRERSASARQFTATSTDGGKHFTAGRRTALGAAPVGAIAAAGSRTLFVSSDDTYRSTDGGRHFARLSANAGSSPGQLGWLGFASPTVAHAVSVDRRTLWVTTDAGRHWRAGRLS